MLVYIEYISRRPGVSLEGFHGIIGGGQSGWAGEYAEDRLVLNLARTWRLGPEPEYLTVWYTPDAGLERLSEWEKAFTSGEVAAFEEPFRVAGRIDVAGCYEPLLEPVAGERGPYYAEYFDFARGVSRDEVRSYFGERRERHRDFELNLLVDRIGKLGPDPRGLAVWSLPSYAALEGIARELDGVEEPVRLINVALYANFGQEIL
jgi:hypothetical protein